MAKNKLPQYTIAPGRTIERDGKPIVYVSIVMDRVLEGGRAISPADADDLAREIVATLNVKPQLVDAIEYALQFMTCARDESELRTIGKRLAAALDAAKAKP